jgi:hypothetical protein
MDWAGTVCLAAAGCTALHMLVGNKGTGKIFSLLTTAFFLCAVMYPLLSENGVMHRLPSFSVEQADTERIEEMAFAQLKSATEKQLLDTLNTALEGYDLKAEKVEIRMDTLEDGSISITDITVYIPAGNSLQPSWVKQIAQKRLGTEVTVYAVE